MQEEVLPLYKESGKEFEYICCFLATSPLTSLEFLNKGLKLIQNSSLDSIRPIVKYSYPIQRSLKLIDNEICMFFPEHRFARS